MKKNYVSPVHPGITLFLMVAVVVALIIALNHSFRLWKYRIISNQDYKLCVRYIGEDVENIVIIGDEHSEIVIDKMLYSMLDKNMNNK